MQIGQQDVKYMDIVCSLEQDDGTGTGDIIGTCTCTCDIIGTCTSVGTSTCSGTGTGGSIGTCANAQGMNYYFIADGLVRFQDRIYVPDNSELNKVILREFHAKRYLGHRGY